MRRLPLLAVTTAALFLTGCDSGILEGGDDGDSPVLTQAALDGKILFFTPQPPTGDIPNWEYQFNAGSVRGCNMESEYQATGWTIIDDQTVRVHFGSQWEQYRLVNVTGSLVDFDLRGSFEYSSSPGVTMSGVFSQATQLVWCS